MARIEDVLCVCTERDKTALRSLAMIYGDDVDGLLNTLHSLTARIAIMAGVEPTAFAAGVKEHWDSCANAVNEEAARGDTRVR